MNVLLQLKKSSVGRALLKRVLFILFLAFIGSNSFAANYSSIAAGLKISGIVVDNAGIPAIGANIVEKGTVNGTATDLDGKFTLEVIGPESVIVISYLGYITKEMVVGTIRDFRIVLQENVSLLNEVVVIGYGTQKKADVTSSVASVKSEEFNKGAILDAGQLVQGKVAGLQISLPSGDPQATTSVMLRGYSTLLGTTDPLILVDGVPGSFSTVAPEDIESIDVLKDGSSTAIYGTRGTNGVIIITTKGVTKNLDPTIEYNGYVSASRWLKTPDFLSAENLREKLAGGWTFSGANDKDYGNSTNWFDEISQTAITTVSNLTFKSGNEKNGYLASLTYDNKEGSIRTSGSENVRARMQMSHSMFENRLNANLYVIANEENTGMNNNWNYIYRLACIQNPTQAVYDEENNYVERDIYNYDNPVSYLKERIGMTRSRNVRTTGSLEYKPTEALSFKGMYTRKGQSYISGSYYTKKDVTTTSNGYNGYAYRYTLDNIYDMVELSSSWSRSFGGLHHITAIAGYNYESNTSENFGASNRNFPSDSYTYNSMERGLGITEGTGSVSSYKYNTKLIGLFARATYNFDDRFLLMASFRHEGSSKFGADNKWGNFPGVSVGWRINNESFMENISWIDNLKLRLGFGITGIDVSEPYQSLASLDYSEYLLYNGEYIQTLSPVRNANENLRWEKKNEYNIGLDFNLLNNRISGAIDVYQRDTKDGLYNYSVPVPPYQFNSILANVCQIRNRGIEVMVNTVPVQTENFHWNTSVTYSSNQNKLLSLQNDQFQMSTDFFDTGHTGEPIQTTTHRIKEGWAIGNFYGLNSVGLNKAGKWLVERYNFDENGNPISKFYDLAENATSADWQILGNGVPVYYLNWNNNMQYKRLDLSISMRGAFAFQILNYQNMYYGNPTIQYNMLNSAFDEIPIVDRKTGEKTGEKTTISDSQRYLSHYIEDGDYWKIDNITLGYTFNTSNIKAVRHFRIYCSVYNIATITGYTGLDPEVRMTYGVNGYDPGTDARDKYPTVQSFTFGVNMTF
jgi:TonB-linked SusC/RagA family outer membrane protein